jgi:hypothetical protein
MSRFKDPCPHCGRFGHHWKTRNRLSDVIAFLAVLFAIVALLQLAGVVSIKNNSTVRIEATGKTKFQREVEIRAAEALDEQDRYWEDGH